MKWKINKLTFWMLVLLIFVSYSGGTQSHATQIETSQIKTSASLNTILINGNAEFEQYKVNETLVGDGTLANPYIIESLEINGDGEVAVSISNTDVYFVITDSEIYGGTNGILFHNVSNAVVKDNVIRNNTRNGVKIEESNFTSFERNNVYGNGAAICGEHLTLSQIRLNIHAGGGYHFDPSYNSTVTGNWIHENYISGILMENAINITIAGNDIENNGLCSGGGFNDLTLSQTGINDGHGIVAYDTTNVSINLNNINNNSQYGVYLSNLTEMALVSYNNFDFNGQTQQAYDEGPSNNFNCNWWGMATTSHNIDGGGNSDSCTTNAANTIDDLDVPTSTVTPSQTSDSSETSSTEESENGDDGFLPYPMGLFSLILVTTFYRKMRKEYHRRK